MSADTPVNPPPASVEAIAAQYDSSIITRRWLGCWIDLIGAACCLLLPDALLGNALYRQTLWLWLALALAYYVGAEWLWGRTLGKFITGTIIVNKDGGRPSLLQVIVRTVFRLLEVNPLLAGGVPAGIVAALSKHKQRLGDLAANTYVVLSRDLKKLMN